METKIQLKLCFFFKYKWQFFPQVAPNVRVIFFYSENPVNLTLKLYSLVLRLASNVMQTFWGIICLSKFSSFFFFLFDVRLKILNSKLHAQIDTFWNTSFNFFFSTQMLYFQSNFNESGAQRKSDFTTAKTRIPIVIFFSPKCF